MLQWTTLWSRLRERPDQVLVEAGASGELLVARIRLLVTGLLLLIPISAFWSSLRRENFVGFGVTLTAILLSALLYLIVVRDLYRPWLSFVSSAFDVTLVSSALSAFLIFNTPHTAVNSKVVFEAYFIALGATMLRYDARICIMAGLLAMSEYAAIVIYAATNWDLNNPIYAPFHYGIFDWGTQTSRLILLLTATVLATTVVLRGQRLRWLSTNDWLTNLFNRAFFDERFVVEVARAERYGRPLAIALIDIDYFKSFNDKYGHAAGDAALQVVASTIRSTFRLSDIVARYGGEEFVVIMPEVNLDQAIEKLELIRRRVAETPITLPHQEASLTLTISAGIACFPEDGRKESDLLKAADTRLFQAKNSGRNKVVGR